MMCRIGALFFLLIYALMVPASACAQDDDQDPRAYMHGIGAVADGKGGSWIFFSSSGLPPRGEAANKDWTHDIYVGQWNGENHPLQPRIFIKKPEAQEPVSVAETDDGHIMVLTEDGWDSENEVDERYAIYDKNLKTIRSYPQTAADGGHSGHVAASENLFVVAYSQSWVEGGGVDDLGSGKGVYARIYDSKGYQKKSIPLAVRTREWWPLVAASPHRALVVWQGFIKGETYASLKFALIDPQTGVIESQQTLRDDLQYYTYAVSYIPDADRFVIAVTTKKGHGFAYLLDSSGNILAPVSCMPPIMREAGMAVLNGEVYFPSADNRLVRLRVTQDSLSLNGALPSPLKWSTTGSLGLPNNQGGLHWFSLNKSGLQEADFDVNVSSAPTPQDSCLDSTGNPP